MFAVYVAQLQPCADHRLRGEVVFEYAVEGFAILPGAALPQAAAVVDGNRATTQAAVVVQGAIAIENGAVMSPCSRANINAEMRLGGRAFALHLDIAARIADAVSQAGRTAHDARRFVNGAVGIVQGQAVTGAVAAGVKSVDIDVVNAVSAGDVVVIAVGAVAIFLEIDARGVRNDFTHAIKLLLFHALLRHDGNGLRRFAQGEVQSGSRDAGGDGVVGFQRPLGIDDDRRQRRRLARCREGGRRKHGEGSQADERFAGQVGGEGLAHGELRL